MGQDYIGLVQVKAAGFLKLCYRAGWLILALMSVSYDKTTLNVKPSDKCDRNSLTNYWLNLSKGSEK